MATCVLFALSPLAIYYSLEGRMYSLLWVWVLATAWLSLVIQQRRETSGCLLSGPWCRSRDFSPITSSCSLGWPWLPISRSNREGSIDSI